MKLAWSLPALDRLDEGQLEQVWRLAGGHPRSLEYLDSLLSGGQARYPDVTARLGAAIARRLSGADRGRWLAARTGLEAALAEIVALAADDVLLGDLLARLDRVPGAADLLLGVSTTGNRSTPMRCCSSPAPDPAAARPDRAATRRHIEEVLAATGITIDTSLSPRASTSRRCPGAARTAYRRVGPAALPPFRPVPGLPERLAACQAASLLSVSEAGQPPWFFVHRWTATELAGDRPRPA